MITPACPRTPCLPLLAFLLVVPPAFPRDRISLIEFFGYKGLDPHAARSALPVHEGDAFPQYARQHIRESIQRALTPPPTDVAFICCDQNGDTVLFIGLGGATNKRFAYNTAPKETARLSAEIVALSERFDQALEAAVRKGGDAAQEDDFNGYALIKDPQARSIQLAIRDYALKHEAEILTVLNSSSDAHQREIAADALGYVRQSPKQITALVRASRDPDDDVRNDAVRALGVLASSSPALAKQIPPDSFIDMLNSGVWTDRNKGAFLLDALARARDPKLLAALKSKALDSLIEMARWRDQGHAWSAQILLGRIAGFTDDRTNELIAKKQIDVILSAVSRN